MTQDEPRRHGRWWAFYLLATAIAWAGWIPFGAANAGLLHWRIPATIPIAAQYSPAIAALILVAAEGGFAGVRTFLARSLNIRVGARWFVFALLTPPLMGLCLIALHALSGGNVPALASLYGLPDHVAGFLANTHDASGGAVAASGTMQSLGIWAQQGMLPAALVIFGLALANGGISEEAGWRGYAFPSLLRGRRALTASLWTGLMWGLWHTGPAFWAGIFQAKWSVFSIPLEYTIGSIPLSVMICWVFLGARRSLLPGMLFHAAYNSTFFFLTALWTPGRPVVTIPEWLAATLIAMLLVVAIGRKSLLGSADADAAPQAQIARLYAARSG